MSYDHFRNDFMMAADDSGIRAGDLEKMLQVLDRVSAK